MMILESIYSTFFDLLQGLKERSLILFLQILKNQKKKKKKLIQTFHQQTHTECMNTLPTSYMPCQWNGGFFQQQGKWRQWQSRQQPPPMSGCILRLFLLQPYFPPPLSSVFLPFCVVCDCKWNVKRIIIIVIKGKRKIRAEIEGNGD